MAFISLMKTGITLRITPLIILILTSINSVLTWLPSGKCFPGSFLYFVWSSERTGFEQNADATMGESFKQLWGVFPGNIFLVKFNYWFSL